MKNARSFNPIIIFVLIILGGWSLARLFPDKVVAPEKPKNTTEFLEEQKTPTVLDIPTQEKKETFVLPDKFYIKDVPFVSQAPFAFWDHLHEEACEEAAILMAHYFLNGIKEVELEKQDKDINELVDFEKELLNKWESTTAAETARLIEKKYGYEVDVRYDVELEDIKEAIARGNPVLLPANGRELKNPHYKQPGPMYHFLIAIGYGDGQIITHDPGTKFGKDYFYDEKVLYEALGDWNGESGDGRKVMMTIAK